MMKTIMRYNLYLNFLCRFGSNFLEGWPFFAILFSKFMGRSGQVKDLSELDMLIGFGFALVSAGGSGLAYFNLHSETEKTVSVIVHESPLDESTIDLEDLSSEPSPIATETTPLRAHNSTSQRTTHTCHSSSRWTRMQRLGVYSVIGASLLQFVEDYEGLPTDLAEEFGLSNLGFILLLSISAGIGFFAALPKARMLLHSYHIIEIPTIDTNQRLSIQSDDREQKSYTWWENLKNKFNQDLWGVLNYVEAAYDLEPFWGSTSFVIGRGFDALTGRVPIRGISLPGFMLGAVVGSGAALAMAYSNLVINQNDHVHSQQVKTSQRLAITKRWLAWMNSSSAGRLSLEFFESLRFVLDGIGHTMDFSAGFVVFGDLLIELFYGTLAEESQFSMIMRIIPFIFICFIASWSDSRTCLNAVQVESERENAELEEEGLDEQQESSREMMSLATFCSTSTNRNIDKVQSVTRFFLPAPQSPVPASSNDEQLETTPPPTREKKRTCVIC